MISEIMLFLLKVSGRTLGVVPLGLGVPFWSSRAILELGGGTFLGYVLRGTTQDPRICRILMCISRVW